jgi:hypothetical protein
MTTPSRDRSRSAAAIALFLIAACGGESPTDPVTLNPVTEVWVEEAGNRLPLGTSSTTMRMSDGTWRMWLPVSQTYTSTDGLTWVNRATVALPDNPNWNSSVVRYADGTFVMIYEANRVSNNDPHGARFYRATSTNGVAWTKSTGALANGAVMVPESSDANFLGVPELTLLADGRVRMYYVTFGDRMASAISADRGLTWTREGDLTIAGLNGALAVDPDVIVLADGRFRLYFTGPGKAGELRNKSIWSATSSDGRSFVLDAGKRLAVTDAQMDYVDPDVVVLPNGKLRMYYGFKPNESSQYALRSAITN